MAPQWPELGCGVGLRSEHYSTVLQNHPSMDWFEAVSENFMNTGGRPLSILERVRENYPIVLHGVAMSIGSVDPLNQKYLESLKTLVDRIQPELVSDHLCWSGAAGEYLHDLLPLPFTEDSIRHVVNRVDRVQNFLGREILLENVSTYVTFKHSEMPEWEFLKQVALQSGCGILLDINNIYVNSVNHQFNPLDYLLAIPGELVGQFHLAGHTNMGKFLFDTHAADVIDEVWTLYRQALSLWGKVSTLIEWDENIPSFERLSQEAEKAREIYRQAEPKKQAAAEAKKQGTTETKAVPAVSLEEAQHWMLERIQPPARRKESRLSKNLLNAQGGDPGIERMSVYAGGYLARTHNAMAETYEAVQFVLGEHAFIHLCEDFIQKYNTPDYRLTEVGKELDDYLRTGHPLTVKYPYLADLAELEWRINQAFHAFLEPSFDSAVLQGVDESILGKMKIIFQPCVYLVESDWPVLDIWQCRKQNREDLDRVRLQNSSQKILIGRRDTQIRTEILDTPQYRLIKSLMSGNSLENACEAMDISDDTDLPVAEWFSGWVRDGLISCIDLVYADMRPRSNG